MAVENDASRRCRENTAGTRCGEARAYFSGALPADAQEILSLEGGTADQSAVHVLGEEFRRV